MKVCVLGPERSIHLHRFLREMVSQGLDVYVLETAAGLPEIPDVTRVPIRAFRSADDRSRLLHYARESVGLVRSVPLLGKVGRHVKNWAWLTHKSLQIKSALQSIRPDILHAHYVQRYGWLGWACGFHPFIVTAWGGDILEEQGGMSEIDFLFTPRTLAAADFITSWSLQLVNRMVDVFGARRERMAVIPFGTNLSAFRLDVSTEELRSELCIPEAAKVVCCPRACIPEFNLDTVVRAVAELRQNRGMMEIILILKDGRYGNRSYYEEIRRLAENLGVIDAVRFHGPLSEARMAQLNCLSDVIVSLGDADGFPSTFFEAMACGTPLVISDIEPSLEAVNYGVVAKIVDRRSPSAVADAIYEILTEPEFSRRARATGPVVAAEHGDIRNQVRKYVRLYKSLVS